MARSQRFSLPKKLKASKQRNVFVRPTTIKRRRLGNQKWVREYCLRKQGHYCCGLLFYSNDGQPPIHKTCGNRNHTDLDHMIELQNGGKDEIGNLQLLCHECHVLKTNMNREARRLKYRFQAVY